MMTHFLFTKNTWIGDSGASCHITNNNSGLYDITKIDEFIQGSSGIMSAMKKGKLQVKVHQILGTEWVHAIWPMKFCPKAGVILFSLTCELLQGHKIETDQQNNIVVNTPAGNIILDCQIKTCDGSGVNFLCKANNERSVSATTLPKRNIHDLHVELGHPSETITQTTMNALGIQVIGIFKPCEDCILGKAKQQAVSKRAVPCWNFLVEKLFFNISSPTTLTFGGKCHWLLVIDNCSDYIWSFFLKEKSNLAEKMLGLVKNLKIKFILKVQYLHCNNARKNEAFKRICNQEWLGIDFQYTAPCTPQQNRCIKHKLATLFNWVCALLNASKFTTYLQSVLWAEATNTATLLENNLITPNRILSPFQQFFGKGK